MNAFPCSACGLCCRRVHLSEQTAFLDRGNGVCRYLDTVSNLCSIYEIRPLVCQVKEYYQVYLKDTINWDDFVKINLEVCHQLQQEML